MPLAPLDHTDQLRRDKLAVAVTTIRSQQLESWIETSSQHSSKENLNQLPPVLATNEREIGLRIYRTIEVTSTSTSTGENLGSVLHEHV
jgi:arginine deiminase